MLHGWHLMGYCLKYKSLLLISNIFIIIIFIWFIMPNLNIALINNNIKKDIEANAYLYTEIEIKDKWGM